VLPWVKHDIFSESIFFSKIAKITFDFSMNVRNSNPSNPSVFLPSALTGKACLVHLVHITSQHVAIYFLMVVLLEASGIKATADA
jgi:hypothetical protein